MTTTERRWAFEHEFVVRGVWRQDGSADAVLVCATCDVDLLDPYDDDSASSLELEQILRAVEAHQRAVVSLLEKDSHQ